MSQETCLDNIHVLGRGVPVVRLRFRARCRSRNPDVSLRPLPPTLGVEPMSTATSASTVSTSSLPVASLGTPRIGPRRELKFALESFWSGATDEKALIETGVGLRAANWARQKKLGVSVIPSNDFSFYDQMLDMSVMVGAIPDIYRWNGGPVPLATYFAMARGAQGKAHEPSCGHAHHADEDGDRECGRL